MKNIIIVLFALIIVMLGLSWIINRDKVPSEVLLTVTLSGKSIEIGAFPEDAIEIVETGPGRSEQAIAVKYFLKSYLEDNSWNKLTFISSDNAELTINRKELDSLYLSLISKEGESYLRLIIPSDAFHQRWLKYITQIDLK
ncbi:MAG: hypothetical protein RAO94_10985 [Candidatus Stygibacter australis]|nr:hypothetical protein [Candidatus Stygibacter australis]MDP8322864.1 hypothetical protein [Candidatus Stygibacter australis]